MHINIRLAHPADVSDMAEIHARSWKAAYKDILPMAYIEAKNATRLAQFRRIITEDNDSQYIIECNGKAVGIMCVDVPQKDTAIINDSGTDDSFYELHAIYLLPEYYRKGIGTITLNFAFAKAREAGKCHMILWVFEENGNAVRFYESCGFYADGASKLYDCGETKKVIADILAFEKELKEAGFYYRPGAQASIRGQDYLNQNPSAAKAYEDLKVSLAARAPVDGGREQYLKEKHDFIVDTLRKAMNYFGEQQVR